MAERDRRRGSGRRKTKKSRTGWANFFRCILFLCLGAAALGIYLGEEAKALLPSSVNTGLEKAEQLVSAVMPGGESVKEESPQLNSQESPSEQQTNTAGENMLEEQPVVLDSGQVSVVVESLERNDSGFRIIIALTNERNEDVTWTLDAVNFDGMNVPVGDSCAVPAGKSIRYGYSVSGFLVDMFVGHGSHEVSVSSTVKNSSGDVIASGSSGTVTLEN